MFYVFVTVFHDFTCLSQVICLNLVNFIVCYLFHNEADRKFGRNIIVYYLVSNDELLN